MEIDPGRCPLCSQSNACGRVGGQERCWCYDQKIPSHILDTVPAAARNLACLCRSCASAQNTTKVD